MAFLLGNQIVLDDTESGHLSKLQINGTDVLTLNGSTITLKNVDIADSIEGSINSDNVAEGSTNRFFTAARETVLTTADSTATTDRALIRTEFATADTGITTALQSYADTAEADAISTAAATAASLDTTQTAANKLVWEAYADSVVTSGTGSLDTDDITEAGNLYYTDARADARAQAKIDALVDAAPGTLDTLNELAAALGDDANFSTTVTNLIGAETTRATAAEASKIGNVVEDTTPQLGGNLDVNGNSIVSTGPNDIEILTGTGADQLSLGIGSISGTGYTGQGMGIASSTNAGSDILLLGDLDFTGSGYVGEFIGTVALDGATSNVGYFGLTSATFNGASVAFNTMFAPSIPCEIAGMTGTANEVGLVIGSSTEARIHQIDSSGNTIFKLPAADGTANQVIETDGAGDLSWVTHTDTNTNTTYTAGNGLNLNTTEFEMSGSYTGDFTATGDVTAYSDERLKRNIETINKPIDIVNALRGVKFEKDGRHSTGVIAQEVEKVLPEVVHTDAEGMKSVAYGNVVGVLIEAIKEQQKQIDWLTAFWQSDAERDSFNKD